MDPRRTLTLGDVVREHARGRPDHAAVVDGGLRLTYPEFDARSDRVAGALAAAGVGEGDRVCWLGQNCFRLVELLVGAGRLGAITCPVNWRQTADEMAAVIDDLRPRVIVWQEAEIGDVVRTAREQAAAAGNATWWRHDDDGDGDGTYEAAVHAAVPIDGAITHDPDRAVLALYTAAFSGRPAAAMLSHTALLAQAMVTSRVAEIDAGYVYLNSGPLFHVATLMSTLATLLVGGTNVFTRRVDAEELCRLVDAERCTGAFLQAPTVKEILTVNAEGRYDLSSLRTWPGKAAWNEMITVDTSPWARHPGGYGQTEVAGMLTFAALAPGGVGGAGRASPFAQVRVVDEDDHEVPVGEVGEIVCRGPIVMNGYWDRPEETRRRARGGWHHTNDLGRRETDGTLTFVGPKGRLIKSAAENVYPTEVEAVLRAHPDVVDAAVIGMPDRTWTQRVKAIVVLRDGATTTPDALIAHCRARIASYKKPREVAFVERIPRNGMAIDYDELDAHHGGGGYPGAGR